ncbi:MAG: hypothetical protein V4628_07465 [Pseudomonadota bacterium]
MDMYKGMHAEDFWIDVVEGSYDEGEPLIYVPLSALPRGIAMSLAVKLGIAVFMKGDNYLFSTNQEFTKELLIEEDTLH